MKISPHEPYRILLVDDNRDGLLVRRALLGELGYIVDIAENGARALNMLALANYDVVVTDQCMPGMDGAELIQKIRSANPDTRVIMLSGFAEGMGLTEENTGADIVLMKSSREGVHLVRALNRLMTATLKRKPPAQQKQPPPSQRRRRPTGGK